MEREGEGSPRRRYLVGDQETRDRAERGSAVRGSARAFSSAVARNNGNGTFTLEPLPVEAQFAPIYASLTGDFDGDGHTDLLVGGNFYGVTPVFGRYDASYGLMLRGSADGRLVPVDMEESNLVIDGQVRDLKSLLGPNGERLIAVARNNDKLEILRINKVQH